MIVFNAFKKILWSNKVMIIIYTLILVLFAGFNSTDDKSQMNFSATKPDILIINHDKDGDISKSLIEYIGNNSNLVDLENDDKKIADALFFREVNCAIFIPSSFSEDFENGKNPKIEIKSSKDYNSSLAELILKNYLSTASIYRKEFKGQELVDIIEKTLSNSIEIGMTNKLDTKKLSELADYYNFANYSLLAGCVFVICMILTSFKNANIEKRTIVSSINYKKFNRQLLLSNALFAFSLWLIYIILSIILIGKSMLTVHGLLFAINSLIFSMCTLTIAFLIANAIKNKEAISGIVNVVALGSSFLSGTFVPTEYLPDGVLKIARILPSYYYIDNNNLIKNLEKFDFKNLYPLIMNTVIIIAFALIFMAITNFLSKKNRKKARL